MDLQYHIYPTKAGIFPTEVGVATLKKFAPSLIKRRGRTPSITHMPYLCNPTRHHPTLGNWELFWDFYPSFLNPFYCVKWASINHRRTNLAIYGNVTPFYKNCLKNLFYLTLFTLHQTFGTSSESLEKCLPFSSFRLSTLASYST